MKKHFLMPVIVSLVIPVCASLLLRNNQKMGFADTQSFEIVMNSSKNKFHSFTDDAAHDGNEVIKTELGNDIGFSYYQLKGDNSSWHILGNSGYFYNTDPIHGLESITLTFKTDKAQYKIYYSGDKSLNKSSILTSSSSSSTTFNFNNDYPNYFKIENISGSDFNISSANLSLYCNNFFTTLNVSSSDETMGTVSGSSGAIYSGSSCTVSATPNSGYRFMGWYSDETLISTDNPYTFQMPYNDYTLIAKFVTGEEGKEAWNISHGVVPTLSEDKKTITYGLYPQTNVNDETLLSALNNLTTPEDNGWYLYNNEYYAKLIATPYEPNSMFNNGTAIESGATYWFKCEPITWNVLSNNSGEYYILSSVLLDIHCYYNDAYSNRTIGDQTIYPNNYEYSDIRKWLNEDFYDSAFALGKKYIQTTTVDNSASTTKSSDNIYVCNNTNDNVFLPSYQDYINSSYGFSTSTSGTDTRICKTTDWGRARGALYETESFASYRSYYWTRSPDNEFPGDVSDVRSLGFIGSINVNITNKGVRPAITLKIA